MGQYYMPVIQEGKKLYKVYSHDFNNGLKLMEHSYIGNTFVNVVCNYIVDNAVKLWWCGDYAEEGDFKNEKEFKRVYDYAWEDKDNTTLPEPNAKFDWSKQWYFINETKKEYVVMPKYNKDEYTISPISLLTSVGNGRGGGDYWGKNEYIVGYWAGDEVYLSQDLPTQYYNITEDCDFKEEY